MKYNYLPPLSNIRSSLKYRSREYILENSLHGVPYFADPTRPIWERGIWFVLTMASIGTTILTIITIWHKFQEEPTVTGIDTLITGIKTITYPQILLCFAGNQLNYSGISESEQKFYETIYDWKWNEKINTTTEKTISKKIKSYRKLFMQWAPDCNAILHKYILRNGTDIWDNDFVNVVTPNGLCCKYTLTRPLAITEHPWSVRFTSTVFPFRLYLMNYFDVGPSRDAYPLMHLQMPANIRLEVYYTYSTPDLAMLSRYQRQCYYENEQSTYNNCRLNCVSNDISHKCNCLPWFFAAKGVRECTISEYSCVSRAYQKDIDCGCVLPCNFTAFQPMTIEQEKEEVLFKGNESTVIYFLWPKRLFRREIRFGYLDLVVSFGGIAGLFLGYSILTSVELFYYFTFRTYCGAVLDSSRRKNVIKIREKNVKTPPKSNIKFIHYDYYD